MRTTPRVAGFRSEYPAGFELECMAGFVGIRTRAIRSFIPQLSPSECANYFAHAGYASK